MLKNVLNAGYSKPLVSQMLAASSPIIQQLRTTFVVKRKYNVPLSKKNEPNRKLRGRHFCYVLIEDSNTKKQPNMDVILTEYVAGLGKKGQVVNVRPTVAYNKLLLPGLAAYCTPANIEKYSKLAEETKDEEVHSSQYAQRTKQLLECRTFSIIMNKDHPWELEPWHIRTSLRKAAVHILKDSSIKLPAQKITGPDLAKENKTFTVEVKINNTEVAKVRCVIHHWSTDPVDRLPYNFEFFKKGYEPLFPEEHQALRDAREEKSKDKPQVE